MGIATGLYVAGHAQSVVKSVSTRVFNIAVWVVVAEDTQPTRTPKKTPIRRTMMELKHHSLDQHARQGGARPLRSVWSWMRKGSLLAP